MNYMPFEWVAIVGHGDDANTAAKGLRHLVDGCSLTATTRAICEEDFAWHLDHITSGRR